MRQQMQRNHPSVTRESEERNRFVSWFPKTAKLVGNPLLSLIVAALLAGPLALYSIHFALAPFCCWIFLCALRIDAPLLSRLVLPPLGVLFFLPTLGMAIGVPMFLDSQEITFSRPHLLMQLVFILGSPLLFLGYRLGRGRIHADWWPAGTTLATPVEGKSLTIIALFLCAYDVTRMAVGWRSGSLDRGYAGEVVLDQAVGIWTLTGLFNRWSSLWFFLLPYLWTRKDAGMRFILSAVLVFYILVAFASGSRGLVLIPVIYGVCGSYFFGGRPTFHVERWVPLLLLMAFAFIYVVDIFRNTEAFRESQLSDLRSRLAAARNISSAATERQDFAFTTGRALIGVADDIVYDMTPDDVPFAGGGDIARALYWTWIPQTLAPNKPTLVDGNEIVVAYTNIRNDRSFASISLGADLFRRFGFLGVFVGLPFFGAFYGLLIRWIIGLFRDWNVVVGISCLVLIVGGLQNPHTATVLQTWWIWAYDMPKHLLPLGILVFFATGGSLHGFKPAPAFRAGRLPARF